MGGIIEAVPLPVWVACKSRKLDYTNCLAQDGPSETAFAAGMGMRDSGYSEYPVQWKTDPATGESDKPACSLAIRRG